MIVLALLVTPLLGAALSWILTNLRARRVVAVAGPVLVILVGLRLVVLTRHGVVTTPATGRVDALSALLVVLVGVMGLLAGLRLGRVLTDSEPRAGRRYGALVQLFLAAMLGALVTANLGVLWLMIELTTVATSFLVAHRGHAKALEASWKYVVLCSLGIAVALLGLVIIYFASAHVARGGAPTLDLTHLRALGTRLNGPVVRLGGALALVGFATKVGLAPLHTWLPDAHSQAPAPVSGLMSGVLLAVALYALIRVKSVVDAVLGASFSRDLLVVLALGSLVVAVTFLLATRDLKRLLAYSSMEHLALATLAVAAGTKLALAAALFHVMGHGLVKSSVFHSAGEIVDRKGTSDLGALRGILRGGDPAGRRLAVGVLALVGFPPFSLFLSELLMTRAEFRAGLGVVASVQVLLAVGAGVVTLWNLWPVFLGERATESVVGSRRWSVPGVSLGASVLLALVGGSFGALLLHAGTGVLS
jgi:hydrogenase-4 component F